MGVIMFRIPTMFICSIRAFRVEVYELLKVRIDTALLPVHKVIAIRASSGRRAEQKALISAGGKWPPDEGWRNHGVSVTPVSKENLIGMFSADRIFSASLQGMRARFDDNLHVDHRSGAFIFPAKNRSLAECVANTAVRHDFPESDGWSNHSVVVEELSREIIRRACESFSDLFV